MNRRGFALLAVLWVLTALTALTGAGLLVARLGSETTRNRMLLARADWGREACGEILAARFAVDATIRGLDPMDLGRGTWCRALLDDPTAKLNVNLADLDALAKLLTALGVQRAIADSTIARRRLGTIYDLSQIPGLDSSTVVRLLPFLTTRGTGAINVNAARPEVLRVLPGVTEETVLVIMSRRSTRTLHNADELSGAVSRSSRTQLLASYAEFVRVVAFAPPQLMVTLEGGVHGTAITSRATVTVVPVSGRLAVIRRETE